MTPWKILFTMVGWSFVGVFALAALIGVFGFLNLLTGGHP